MTLIFNFDEIKRTNCLAYFAGIIDGEGSIGIERLKPRKDRQKEYYTCRLTVINTNEELMKNLVETFGGKYDVRKQIIGRKKCFRWYVCGNNLEYALQELLPYLLIKKQQAWIVLKYRITVGKTGWNVTDDILKERQNLWLQCRELNKLG